MPPPLRREPQPWRAAAAALGSAVLAWLRLTCAAAATWAAACAVARASVATAVAEDGLLLADQGVDGLLLGLQRRLQGLNTRELLIARRLRLNQRVAAEVACASWRSRFWASRCR